MLVYFLKGKLPWQGIKGVAKMKEIVNLKENVTIEELTMDVPIAFYKYMKYCRGLDFYSKPNYQYCRDLFIHLMEEKSYVNDKYFDWLMVKAGEKVPEWDYYDYKDPNLEVNDDDIE